MPLWAETDDVGGWLRPVWIEVFLCAVESYFVFTGSGRRRIIPWNCSRGHGNNVQVSSLLIHKHSCRQDTADLRPDVLSGAARNVFGSLLGRDPTSDRANRTQFVHGGKLPPIPRKSAQRYNLAPSSRDGAAGSGRPNARSVRRSTFDARWNWRGASEVATAGGRPNWRERKQPA
jgi:hypothetical protein